MQFYPLSQRGSRQLAQKVFRLIGPAVPRQDGRSNLQVGFPSCFCADVEQELVLFWRGDVEACIINRDGFRAAEGILVDAREKKNTWTTRCFVDSAKAGAIIWTGAPVTFGSRPRARTPARPL